MNLLFQPKEKELYLIDFGKAMYLKDAILEESDIETLNWLGIDFNFKKEKKENKTPISYAKQIISSIKEILKQTNYPSMLALLNDDDDKNKDPLAKRLDSFLLNGFSDKSPFVDTFLFVFLFLKHF